MTRRTLFGMLTTAPCALPWWCRLCDWLDAPERHRRAQVMVDTINAMPAEERIALLRRALERAFPNYRLYADCAVHHDSLRTPDA